jgi:DNA-binding NtrC family response regulator
MDVDKTIKLLIVDDEKASRDVLEGLLCREERIVKTAADGLEAKALLSRDPFDLIVTDLNMPGMDGMALLRYVRASLPQALVIMVTGYATLDSTITAIEEGAYDYITKPFKLAAMELLVGNACEKIILVREKHALIDEIGRMHQETESLVERIGTLEKRIEELEEKEGTLVLEALEIPTAISRQALPVRYGQGPSRMKYSELLISRLKEMVGRGELSESECQRYIERLRGEGTIIQH